MGSHCDYCFGNECNPCTENDPRPRPIVATIEVSSDSELSKKLKEAHVMGIPNIEAVGGWVGNCSEIVNGKQTFTILFDKITGFPEPGDHPFCGDRP